MDVDVVVIGAGHAGVEAAAVSARLGARTACVTFSLAHIGRLSCNPAFGGQGKGQLVRELDALGGVVGRLADRACIQFRTLNTRKGLAVQSSRAQVDCELYPRFAREELERIDGLVLIEGEVTGVRTRNGAVCGVVLGDGTEIACRAVVATTGTFLGAIMHRGLENSPGGRVGDPAAAKLSGSLADLGLRLGRLKTGTPPRLLASSIQWDRVEVQKDTVPDGRFSFGPRQERLPQRDCYVTYTSEATHAAIRAGLDRSPLFTGVIQGTGPRYCPSIEDKVVRFADKDRHLIFLEPEGLTSERIYPNGLSTSLPADVQQAMIHSIVGLEDAVIVQPGYAVEYDFADPTDLGPDLQHKSLRGLFLAGQVNGTSGYEEAAAQGFWAGVAAARGEGLRIGRHEGYIGVMVDDLVSKGVGGEPYRMFTSRAEHRLVLREDNADRRLMPIGRALGLIDDETWRMFETRVDAIERGTAQLAAVRLAPDRETLQRAADLGIEPWKQPVSGADLLRRPNVTWEQVSQFLQIGPVSPEVSEQIDIDTKYASYVQRANERAEATARMDGVEIPADVDWTTVGALSTESRHRIQKAKPGTLGQLARLPGITPAAVGAVAAWLTVNRR